MDCNTVSYPDLLLATSANPTDELTIVVAGQPKRITVNSLLSTVQSNAPGEVTFNGSGTFQVPAGKLLQDIVLITSTTNTIKIGTTTGGNEIDENEVSNSQPYVSNLSRYFDNNQTLHFTGNATAKIYYR